MKLRNQILALGFVGVLMATLVGGIGLFNSSRLAQSIDDSVSMGQALRSNQEANMMQAAVRGDVLQTLFGAANQDGLQLDEAKKALMQHSASFNQSLTTLQALPLAPEVRAIVESTLPLVKKYTNHAAYLQQQALLDAVLAQAELPQFQKLFKQLETQMAVQADAIEKSGKASNQRAQQTAGQLQIHTGMALALAAAVLVLAARWFARYLSQPMAYAVSISEQLAQGDLSVPVQPGGNDETTHLLLALERIQTSFGRIVKDVKHNADGVATASAEIAQGNHDLSARTEHQASALEETAASMEQLNATVKQNACHADEANRLSIRASNVALQCGQVVSLVVKTMKGINESSDKIADIIQVIDGIAFQTNILALNAAVEAARAGEQGRGFAVVASEVRSLASRSAEAAKEIKLLINASVERVTHGTSLVDQAGMTMTEVVSAIQRVTDIMGEISMASSEQSRGVSLVGHAVTQMDQVTQQNAALVEAMADAASHLKSQAHDLVDTVAIFKLAENI